MNSKSLFSFYFLGVLNGFVPCGLVYFFIAFAISSASAFYGALIMLIFGLFTTPAMLIFSSFVTYFSQTNFRSIMMKIAAIIVILYGIYFSFRGYMQVIGGI